MLKKILIVIVAILLIIQVFRPEKNISDINTNGIATKYQVPADVDQVLKSACNDCHSNLTAYPWYADIQPVAWWLDDHVQEGKRELNFSEFTSRPIAVQNHKFEEIVEMVEEKEMPLPSYTWLGLHSNAKLDEQQRKLIINWAKAQMDTLKAQYPPDSLILKRRG
jgi:Haem-binding domain